MFNVDLPPEWQGWTVTRPSDDTIAEAMAKLCTERDAVRAELAALKAQRCAVCDRQHPGMNTVTLCDRCYEDRLA